MMAHYARAFAPPRMLAMSCCGSSRKNSVLIILSALLLLGVIAVWRVATEKPPQVEMVRVLVATRDLPTGTAFTKENVDQLTGFIEFPRSGIPEESRLIQRKDELVSKRLSRVTHQGEWFYVADVGGIKSDLLEPGKDVISIPVARAGSQGFIGPGSRVDVFAGYVEGNERQVFTLLPDVLVLSVGLASDLTKDEPSEGWVSFAVDPKHVLLIALANQLNCAFEVVVRGPDSPNRNYDYDKTLARLKEVIEKRESRIAPAPRAKDDQ
ncbi:MAG: Flp pilus assembly protein CpaB [Planctomycetaceae bacterium]|nr:Flp pilus assembly protein CpaB [Planctomycetaceae bacterium]